MGSHELDESYFSCSTPAFGERARPRLGREDSVGDALFTLSGCNTPTLETVPAVVDYVCESSPKAHRHGVGGGKLRADKSKSDAHNALVSSHDDFVERSRPIPIGYMRPKSAALVEPVSARGDLAEAYFPMHEKEGDRQQIYQPHPFSQEVKRARQRSISEAEASVAVTETRSIASASAISVACAVQRVRTDPAVRKVDARVPAATAAPERRSGATWRGRTAPIVDAYNPTGIPGSAASLGKYYPTNYNKSSDSAGSVQSPGPASEVTFSLSTTDQEHQLRQYKLDIISQTTQIARETLGQNIASMKAVETILDERTRKSVALLGRYKPSSPRITPLLSPGPVTPMALDANGESDYLSVREARLC